MYPEPSSPRQATAPRSFDEAMEHECVRYASERRRTIRDRRIRANTRCLVWLLLIVVYHDAILRVVGL